MISPRTRVSAGASPNLEALDLGAEVGGGVDGEDGGGRAVEVEDCDGPDRGERDDMGDKRRVILVAAKLEGAPDIASASPGL